MIYHLLSVRQPWASLIMASLKHYETRTWQPKHRGLLIIQAAENNRDLIAAWENPTLRDTIDKLGYTSIKQFPRGAALGTVELLDIHRGTEIKHRISTEELALGDYDRAYAWQLTNPQRFTRPFLCKGALPIVEIDLDFPLPYPT